jgi:hypothetical protein
MRKVFALCGLALVALLSAGAPAAADHKLRCESEQSGVTVRDVYVPRGASCILLDSTVTGNVYVSRDAFFEARNTDIAGEVHADDSLTVFLDTDTSVGRSVKIHRAAQVFIFNATVGGDLEVEKASEVVQVCGTTVEHGDLEIERSGTDLLVGDPQAKDCSGNTVSNGDIEIEHNFTDVEFVVRGNTIGDDLEVNRNTGPVEKFVQDNTGGDELECARNEDPFTASGNTGWREKDGQCEEVLTCQATETGVTVDEVIVPADSACTLVNSKVTGDVHVASNAFFQADNSAIGGNVRGNQALTVFLNTGTTVGGSVKTRGTAQVFVFNAAVGGDLDVEETTEVVQVCGTTVERGDLEVERSGTDLLIGDPQAEACAGNTVTRGDVEIERNFTDVEFVVRGNTIGGDLEVNRNSGPAEKFVQDNVGGDELECERNETPFSASGNSGWRKLEGQCAEPAV